MRGYSFDVEDIVLFIGGIVFVVAFIVLMFAVGSLAASQYSEEDPWERCLRDWPLAECQARKDAGALE